MKKIMKTYRYGFLLLATMGILTSCSEMEMPLHELDVEFRYELTCSEALLKYVTPEVTITDRSGTCQTFSIENEMWKGNEHKTWTQSVHYDSLNVSSSMTVKYVPKAGVIYQDELDFDNVHNLSCLVIVQEDGEGRRNNYTIVPDFPSKTDVKAEALKNFIEALSNKLTTRGGKVDLKGEITKMEIN